MISTRLEILGKNYPLVQDVPISINYVQADVREPDKRNASYTKTVQLYGTNDTNILFENIFEYNVETGYFNVNKKTTAIYYVNDIENFRGDLQLIRVTRKPDNSIIYECSISGNEGALFFDIANDYLTDLDFSEYNHDYTREKIIDSWSNICDVSGTPTTLANGEGYLYGFVQRGFTSSENIFGVTDFLPQLYLREYLYKIFTAKGYTWSSSILDSAEFKSIVVEPNNSGTPLTQTQLNNKQFYVGMTTDHTFNAGLVTTLGDTYLVNHDNESAPFFDLASQASGTTVTIAQNGYYNVAAKDAFNVNFTTSSTPTVAFKVDILCTTTILKSSDGGTTWTQLNQKIGNFGGSAPYRILKNIDNFYNNEVATGSIFLYAGEMLKTQSTIRFFSAVAVDGSGIALPGVPYTPTYKLSSGVNGSSFYSLVTSKNVAEGDTCYINNAIPKNIKQKDFVKSVMQMFNLFIQPDKQNPKLLTIESYSDFFNADNVNWENKIDLSKDIIVNPVSLIDGKTYFFQYKDDKDFYNTKYKENWNEAFGTKRVDVDNDFLKQEKKNELIFSSTPNVANYFLGIAVPKIYKEDPSVSVKSITPNLRLLYYGGIKQAANPWTFKKIADTDLVDLDYPYVGHVDDPQTPTYDLNFGTPKEVYYNFINTSFTTNNLYNRFHKQYIENITNRDSRVIIAYLWLSPKDIYEFSFRNKYFISGAYYIVNKIIDYNPLEQKSTKCELIKVLEGNVFTPENILFSDSPDINSGYSETINPSNTALRLGTNSNNYGTNSILVGNNSRIGVNASNNLIIGDNVNSEYDNIVYLNGSVIPTINSPYSVIKTVTADYNIKFYDGLILVDASGGNVNIDLSIATTSLAYNTVNLTISGVDYSVDFSKIITIKKIDSTSNIVTLDNGTYLIDDTNTKDLTAQYDALTIQWDGTNWHII